MPDHVWDAASAEVRSSRSGTERAGPLICASSAARDIASEEEIGHADAGAGSCRWGEEGTRLGEAGVLD